MIRSIIVDDLTHSRERFYDLLSNCKDIAVLAAVDSSVRAVRAINAHHPDLIFLNVSKSFKKGLKVLERTRMDNIQVILTSEQNELDIHEQYALAVKAIKLNVLDHLQAPVQVSALKKALKKVKLKASKNIPRNGSAPPMDNRRTLNPIIVFDTEEL